MSCLSTISVASSGMTSSPFPFLNARRSLFFCSRQARNCGMIPNNPRRKKSTVPNMIAAMIIRRTGDRALGAADAADDDHRQLQEQAVHGEQRGRGALEIGRVETANRAQRSRRDQEDLDARVTVIDAECLGKGLLPLGRSTQQKPEPSA